MELFTLTFWKRVFENGVHAFAGGMLGVLGGKGLGVAGLASLPWTAALDAGLIAVILSVLLSLSTSSTGVLPNSSAGGFLPEKK
jgi:hypothetical protein